MPAFLRTRSPEADAVATGMADLKAVSFAADPVSRQLSERELTKLWFFEDHAARCRQCHNPYDVHKTSKQLCAEGHRLAQRVTAIIYSKDNAAVVYSRSDSPADQRVRVDVPKGYKQVLNLMRAMERSLRHRRQRPIVSHDATYHVLSRPVDAAALQRRPSRSSSPTPSTLRRTNSHRSSGENFTGTKPRRNSVVVDWPEAELRMPSLTSVSGSDMSMPPSSPKTSKAESRRPISMYASPTATIHRSSSVRRALPFPPSSYRGPRNDSLPNSIPSLASLSLDDQAQVKVQAEQPTYDTAVRVPSSSSRRSSAIFP